MLYFRHLLHLEVHFSVIKPSLNAKVCRIAAEWLQIYCMQEKMPDFVPEMHNTSRKWILVQSSETFFFLTTSHMLMGWLGEAKESCSFCCGVPNWYWLTVGQGLLSLQQVRVEGGMLLFLLFLHLFHFPFSSLSLSFISSTISSLFSLSLGDDTKWPTRVDVSLNPTQSINHICLCWSEIKSDYYCGVFNH